MPIDSISSATNRATGNINRQTANIDSQLAQSNDGGADIFMQAKEIAKAQNLPPYIIFHDKTLLEMVKQRPQNLAEMGKISGVGEAKIKKYGKVFLEVIGS